MSVTKSWTVEIRITEADRQTEAEARLSIDDLEAVMGHGTARLNPNDSNVPVIGDELAVARALSNLSYRLLETAVEKLEGA
jgi:hypothetical protein